MHVLNAHKTLFFDQVSRRGGNPGDVNKTVGAFLKRLTRPMTYNAL